MQLARTVVIKPRLYKHTPIINNYVEQNVEQEEPLYHYRQLSNNEREAKEATSELTEAFEKFELESDTTAQNTTAATTAANTATTSTTTADVGRLKTSIHVTALDGIVNVNSLFTMAIFIGFSLTVPEAATAAARAECTASRETVRTLIVYEVVSFSFFLFSSLIAQSLKLFINLLNNMDPNDPHKADVDPDWLKYGLFGSAVGSVVGCLFLMLSIVDFIQVKLGVYSCGGKPVYAVVILVGFVGPALLVYVITAVYASFFVSISTPDDD